MNNTDYFVKTQELARKAGISLAELCRRAGVSRGTLTRWKNGTSTPSMRIWDKLLIASGRAILEADQK